VRQDQPVFRRQWLVDLTYFFVNSLLIEVLTILTLKPALILFDWARVESIGTARVSRRGAGDVHSRQCSLAVPPGAPPGGDTCVSPLAP